MGATALLRLWLLNTNSDRQVSTFQRLQNLHSARVLRRWAIEIRAFQQTAFHASSVSADEVKSSSSSALRKGSARAEQQQRNAGTSQQVNRMWQLTSSEFPDLVFVYTETHDGPGDNVRRNLFVTSSTLSLFLAKSNLPRPLGDNASANNEADRARRGDGGPSATSFGPGAWIPRGAVVTIEGVISQVPDQRGGLQSSLSAADQSTLTGPSGATSQQQWTGTMPPISKTSDAGSLGSMVGLLGDSKPRIPAVGSGDQHEWVLRLGEVNVGSNSVRGSVAELECLALEDPSDGTVPPVLNSFAHTLFEDQTRMQTATGASGLYIYPKPPSEIREELHLDVPLDSIQATAGGAASAGSIRGGNVASSRETERMRRTAYMYIQGLRLDGIL